MLSIEIYINYLLESLLYTISKEPSSEQDKWELYRSLKAKLSTKHIKVLCQINENILLDFENRWKLYLASKGIPKIGETNEFRLIIVLEYMLKCAGVDSGRTFPIQNTNIDMSIKQVRALELIIRDLLYEQIGSKHTLSIKLSELFKTEQVNAWLKNADETGVLSGTTFSELTGILLNAAIYSSIETIIAEWGLRITPDRRESLRFALEDIRVIRNQIAHNKIVTPAQIELMNIYFQSFQDLIYSSSHTNIQPGNYYTDNSSDTEKYITRIQKDRREYWIAFIDFMKSDEFLFNLTDVIPSEQHWQTLLQNEIECQGSESKIYLNITFNRNANFISTELFILSDEEKVIFDDLHAIDFEQSIHVISENLIWDRMDGKKGSRIVFKQSGDFSDKSDWINQFAWLKNNIDKFLIVFGKYFN
jgi:hypothetical protein